jgi:hypothetical protein
LPTAQPCSRLSKKGGVYGPSDLLRGGRRISTFSRVPRRPYLRRLARCWDSVSGRRRTPPRDPAPLQAETGPARTRLATHYPGTCRTDRCRWAARCSQAPLHRPQSLPPRQAVFTIGLPAPISRLAFVGHPTDRAWARHLRREVGRPGCGSPAARLGEDNARLRPPSCPTPAVFRWRRRTVSSAGLQRRGSMRVCRLRGRAWSGPLPARERLHAADLAVPWRCPPVRQASQRRVCSHSIKPIWPARHPPREAPTRAQKCDLKVAERRWSATVVQTLVRYRCAKTRRRQGPLRESAGSRTGPNLGGLPRQQSSCRRTVGIWRNCDALPRSCWPASAEFSRACNQ